MAINNIEQIILRTHASQATPVEVSDAGITVPAAGNNITTTSLHEALALWHSEQLWDTTEQSLVDDAFGAGASTLYFFDGTNPIAQADARAWLTQRILNASSGNFGVVKTNASGQIADNLTFNGTATVSNFKAATDIDAGNNKITNLAEPTAGTDAATKTYVDNLAAGLKWKDDTARCLSASNVTLSGLQTIDGVVMSAGERVLLIGQTTPSENGIWTVAAGAWSRPADFATGSAQANAAIFVSEGTTYADTAWTMTNDAGGDIVDTDDLVWAQFSGAGSINAGDGLIKTGNTLSVDYGILGEMAAGIAASNSAGTAVEVARIDHTHAHGDRGADGAVSQHDADQIDVEGAYTRIGGAGTAEAVFSAINDNFTDPVYVGKTLAASFDKAVPTTGRALNIGSATFADSATLGLRMLRAGRLTAGSLQFNKVDAVEGYKLSVRVNGTERETVIVAATNQGNLSTAWSYAYAAGDIITLYVVPTGTPSGNSTFSAGMALIEYVEG